MGKGIQSEVVELLNQQRDNYLLKPEAIVLERGFYTWRRLARLYSDNWRLHYKL